MAEQSQYLIRPSELYRIARCPGSLAMQHGLPDADNEEAREGTAVHESFAALFLGTAFHEGDTASNGVVFTRTMLDGGKTFHKACTKRYKGEWIIERSLAIPRVHPQCGGTPDARSYDAVNRHIRIGDLKWGHRYVDVFNNEQLLAYLAGYVDELGINGLEEQHTLVTLFIVQERAYRPNGPVTEWTFLLSDVRAQLNILRSNVETSLLAGAVCNPGPHCRDCLADSRCIALQRESAAIMAQCYIAEQFELDQEMCGRELSRLRWALDTIKVRVEGLEAQAENLMHQGKAVPGWTLERTRSREEWDPAKVDFVVGMAETLGIDVCKKREPLTVKQARALGFDGATFEMTVTKSGTLKLAQFTPSNPISGVTEHGE